MLAGDMDFSPKQQLGFAEQELPQKTEQVFANLAVALTQSSPQTWLLDASVQAEGLQAPAWQQS